ncbi:MAG: hypothetical protein R3B96_02720 [Pirellulaceae bacterium]
MDQTSHIVLEAMLEFLPHSLVHSLLDAGATSQSFRHGGLGARKTDSRRVLTAQLLLLILANTPFLGGFRGGLLFTT